MAYMSQEKKKEIAANLKKVMPHGWKYSLGVNHHSTIVLTISEAPIDLIAEFNDVCRRNFNNRGNDFQPARESIQINEFYLDRQFEGKRLEQMQAIKAVLNTGNHDRSDSQTDYFDVGWYVSINFGRWNKPFKVTGQADKIARLEVENRLLKETLTEGVQS